MGQFDFLSVYAISSTHLWVAFWLLIMAVFVICVICFTWWFFANNVKIVTYEQVGQRGQRSRHYSGRHIVKDGSEFLKLSGKKDFLPWPDTKYITNHKGVRYKTLINYYKTSEAPEDWKPIEVKLTEDGVKFEAHDAEVRLWSSTRQREKVSKYDSRTWWDKYGTYLGLGLVSLILVLTVIMTMDALKETTSSIASAQSSVSQDLKQLTQMQERISVNMRGTDAAEAPPDLPPGG